MNARGEIILSIGGVDGLDDAAREDWSRSLISELNEHQPGLAKLALGPPLPVGSKSAELFGMSAEIILGFGAMVSPVAVSAMQYWLERQRPETTLTLKGKNAAGEPYEVTVNGKAPDDILAKLDPFIARQG